MKTLLLYPVLLLAALLFIGGEVSGQQVFWIETTYGDARVRSADADGSNIQTVDLADSNTLPQGLDINLAGRTIYWVEGAYDSAEACRADLELDNHASLVTGGSTFRGVALDVGRGKIYWTSSLLSMGAKIHRANMDGTGEEVLVAYSPGSSANPRGIAIDTGAGKMYWADFGSGKIYRADTSSGATPEDLITGLSGPVGIALDVSNDRIYWTEAGPSGNMIKRSDLNGSTISTLVSSGIDHPNYIALDSATGKMFWTELGGTVAKIRKADMDGSNVEDLGIPVSFPAGIAVMPPRIIPCAMSSRWNIVSLPLRVGDYTKAACYPTAVSAAYAYDGAYITKDTLSNGSGYWLKFDSAHTVPVVGNLLLRDTITVTEGWNMVGSLSEEVDVSMISSNPGGIVTSSFYGYDAGYTAASSIEPGKGYWVKITEEGELILSATEALPAASRIRIRDTGELPPPPPDEPVAAGDIQPAEYALSQNYPNPFNPVTQFEYSIPEKSHVRIFVTNLLGIRVATLVDGEQEPGVRNVEWDASDHPSGVYYYRLIAGGFSGIRKMLLLR